MDFKKEDNEKMESTDKEIIGKMPNGKPLTKAEKRTLHKELAGSAKHFSYEALKELNHMANYGDWEDETE